MTVEEREHYENLARYYNSKKEPCKTEMIKFKCVVEYEYPHEHKPPIQADIYLHGDKVSTSEIKPLQTELEKILTEIQERFDSDCHYDYFTASEIVRFISNRISELKGE